MNRRRQFLRTTLGFLASAHILSGPLLSLVRWAYARTEKAILPKGTKRESLIHRNPESLDTRNLETTPLKDFATMGLSDHEVDLSEWRLEVNGGVKTVLRLTYPEILGLPAMERNILLICPGFFANHGRWKGISMKGLLEKAGVEEDVRHVAFSGPMGSGEKVERFPIDDVITNKVFLAYGVNGETLPKRHGFPLRVVAEDHYGNDWVKYVYRMTLERD